MAVTTSLHEEFLDVVRQEMKRQRLSQIVLAKKIGVTQSYISQMLSGQRVPTLKTVAKFADGLGIDLRIKFGNAGGHASRVIRSFD